MSLGQYVFFHKNSVHEMLISGFADTAKYAMRMLGSWKYLIRGKHI